MKHRKINIKITEDEKYYYLSLPSPIYRERALKIPGARFNPGEKFWYYSKSIDAYNSLYKEFNENAKIFQITKPVETHDEVTKEEVHNFKVDDTSEKLGNILSEIKEEISSFKNVDEQQTESIKLIGQQLNQQMSFLADSYKNVGNTKNVKSDLDFTNLFSWGLGISSKSLEQYFENKVNFSDLPGSLNILHQDLEYNLCELLDIHVSRRAAYSLFDLISEAQQLHVIEKYDASNLHNFRTYRNLYAHGATNTKGTRIRLPQSKMKVAAVIALLSLSLSWASTLKKVKKAD